MTISLFVFLFGIIIYAVVAFVFYGWYSSEKTATTDFFWEEKPVNFDKVDWQENIEDTKFPDPDYEPSPLPALFWPMVLFFLFLAGLVYLLYKIYLKTIHPVLTYVASKFNNLGAKIPK